MKPHPPRPGPGLFGRPVLTITIVLAILVSAGLGSVALANRNLFGGSPTWHTPTATDGSARAVASASAAPAEPTTITLSATGDIVMSSAPSRMPPRDGEGFFDAVRADLQSDLVMGNLEQPLTPDTGTSKCGPSPSDYCFAFRSPPSYARYLKDAGFDLMNTANNHTRDFGTAGARNTRAALDDAGIRYTGDTGEITVVEVEGVRVAVVGFSSYAGANDLNDLDAARALMSQAGGRADLIVVQVHMGAEGADRQHVGRGTEMFHGENRGDPMAFSRAVIDAGADLVIGHGPHVLRGMEFYRGRLIAYSLGNFAGGGRTLSRDGALRYAGILHVTLTAAGEYAGGEFLSTYLDSAGLPARDGQNERGRALVERLSAADFPDTGVLIDEDGSITPRA